MCGEMAGEIKAIPLLLGLGLDEFSMSASTILHARHLISEIDYNEAREIAQKALGMDNEEQVRKLLEEKY